MHWSSTKLDAVVRSDATTKAPSYRCALIYPLDDMNLRHRCFIVSDVLIHLGCIIPNWRIKWRFNKLNIKSCRKKNRCGIEQDRKQTNAQAPDMAVTGIAGFHAVYDLRVSPDNVSPRRHGADVARPRPAVLVNHPRQEALRGLERSIALAGLGRSDAERSFETLSKGTLRCESPFLSNCLRGKIAILIEVVASFLKAQSALILADRLPYRKQERILQRADADSAQTS